METTAHIKYREVTLDCLATKINLFYKNIFALAVAKASINFTTIINNREYGIILTDQSGKSFEDHYVASIQPIKKADDTMDDLITDIMERKTNLQFTFTNVLLTTHEYKINQVSYKKKGYVYNLQDNIHIHTQHKQHVDFFIKEKLLSFFSLKPLSLGARKKMLKALNKVEIDNSITNYISCWKELDKIINPRFIFRIYSLSNNSKDTSYVELFHRKELFIKIFKHKN